MADKDVIEKRLEDYADVFADIANVLLFDGKRLIQPEELLTALPRSVYKADDKLHEQERDVVKFWKKGRVRIAFIGLENQTEIEADMPLRVVSYDGAVYRDQMNHAGKERYPVVTLVLYFGYKKRWDKSLRLKDCFAIPKELEPFVNDYRVNLFEIAWLPDETIQKFQSDFRLVADYFSQKRKNKTYDPPGDTIRHVREVLELLSVLMKDTRFIDAYNERHEEGREDYMDAWLTEIENRGIEQGIKQRTRELVQNMLTENIPLETICKISGWPKEAVIRLQH